MKTSTETQRVRVTVINLRCMWEAIHPVVRGSITPPYAQWQFDVIQRELERTLLCSLLSVERDAFTAWQILYQKICFFLFGVFSHSHSALSCAKYLSDTARGETRFHSGLVPLNQNKSAHRFPTTQVFFIILKSLQIDSDYWFKGKLRLRPRPLARWRPELASSLPNSRTLSPVLLFAFHLTLACHW